MKEREHKRETPSSTRKPAKAENHNRAADANRDGTLADQRLAKRCLAGEVAAWDELYAQCHKSLLLSITVVMAPYNPDPNLVDEIAARVWYALIADDGQLLARYNVKRGARLITFMRALAKTEVKRHVRAERRRRKHEQRAAREKAPRRAADAAQPIPSLEEFPATLTPSERVFYRQCLLDAACDSADQAPGACSPTNARQLAHRVRQKLSRFLGYDS